MYFNNKKFEEKDVFRLVTSEGRSEFLFVSRSWQDENIFLYFYTELKTYRLSYSIKSLEIYKTNSKCFNLLM